MDGVTVSADLVEQALALSRADGATVLVEESSQANLRWANNALTTNGVTTGRQVTVCSTVDGGTGTAVGVLSRAGVDTDSLTDLVHRSEQVARAAAVAPDAQPLVAGGAATDWAAPPEATSFGVFGRLTPALARAFAAAQAEGHLLFGYAEHTTVTSYLGNSAGLRRRHVQPTGRLLLNGKSPDYTRSAFVCQPTEDFADVDLAALGADLAQRMRWARREVALPAGRYETLLPPDAVAELMINLYQSGLSARDAVDGRSVFGGTGGGTRLGEQLCGDGVRVTLRGDPGAAGLACAPFVLSRSSGPMVSVFDNGLALAPTDWIRAGELSTLVTTRHSAQLTGMPVAPPIDNLVLRADGGGRDLAEMVAGTSRGLLLTSLWYVREVDAQSLLLTGLTRDGVYLVENGEVTGSVNNFRFNESPVDLLRRISEAGATRRCLARESGDEFNRTAMPALRVPDFNMSSVSQAA